MIKPSNALKKENKYLPFLTWLIFLGIIFYVTFVLISENLLRAIVLSDKSRIVYLIILLFLYASIMCGIRAFSISKTQSFMMSELSDPHRNSKDSLLSDIEKVKKASMNSESDVTLFYLQEKYKGPNDSLWFISETILKLGLLGTIIGFILMLGPVSSVQTFDASAMQEVLRKMSTGMGTALTTTLAGIICSSSVAFQTLIIDKGSDRLISNIISNSISRE